MISNDTYKIILLWCLYCYFDVYTVNILCLILKEVFASVVTFECLHYVRQQKERFESVTRSIQHFNRLSRLVIATILQSCYINDKYISSPKGFDTQMQINGSEQSSPNEPANRYAESVWNRCCLCRNESTSVSSTYISRGMCISKWIDIAHHCRLLKNFSSLKAIVFGLQSSSVFRISKSWSTVSKWVYITLLHSFNIVIIATYFSTPVKDCQSSKN